MAFSKYSFLLLFVLVSLLGMYSSVMGLSEGPAGVGHIIDAGCREGYVKINGICVEDLWETSNFPILFVSIRWCNFINVVLFELRYKSLAKPS